MICLVSGRSDCLCYQISNFVILFAKTSLMRPWYMAGFCREGHKFDLITIVKIRNKEQSSISLVFY